MCSWLQTTLEPLPAPAAVFAHSAPPALDCVSWCGWQDRGAATQLLRRPAAGVSDGGAGERRRDLRAARRGVGRPVAGRGEGSDNSLLATCIGSVPAVAAVTPRRASRPAVAPGQDHVTLLHPQTRPVRESASGIKYSHKRRMQQECRAARTLGADQRRKAPGTHTCVPKAQHRTN
jgi:hypothetical protein